MKSPFGHAERINKQKKVTFLLLSFSFFISFKEEKHYLETLVLQKYHTTVQRKLNTQCTEHFLDTGRLTVYSVKKHRGIRNKKSVQIILYFLNLFCSTMWQWKRQRNSKYDPGLQGSQWKSTYVITENRMLFSEFDLEYNSRCMVNKSTCNNSEHYPGVECWMNL